MADYSKSEHSPFPHIKENHDTNVAFVIHRNTNKNVVVYAGNFQDDGTVNTSTPIKVYWVMFEKATPTTEGLNMVERNTAYGISTESANADAGEYSLMLTALKDRKLNATIADGNVIVKGTVNGQADCILERVFVNMKTKWGMPAVDHIQIFAKDSNGNEVTETQKK